MQIFNPPDIAKLSTDVVGKILGYLVYPQPYLDNKTRNEIENRSRKILLGTEDDEFNDKYIIEWHGYKDHDGFVGMMRSKEDQDTYSYKFKYYEKLGDRYVEF